MKEIKVKFDGKSYIIPRYSELTTEQFCAVAKSEISNIPQYISLFTDISLDDLLVSDYHTPSKTYLFASIFNVDIPKAIKAKKHTITFKGDTLTLDELQFKTFGKAYLFDIYHQKYKEDKISDYDLFVYALCIALSNDPNLSDVEEIRKELYQTNWLKVMPQAFFLAKRFLSRRKRFLPLLIIYTLGFRKISMKIRFWLKRLQKSETTLT